MLCISASLALPLSIPWCVPRRIDAIAMAHDHEPPPPPAGRSSLRRPRKKKAPVSLFCSSSATQVPMCLVVPAAQPSFCDTAFCAPFSSKGLASLPQLAVWRCSHWTPPSGQGSPSLAVSSIIACSAVPHASATRHYFHQPLIFPLKT